MDNAKKKDASRKEAVAPAPAEKRRPITTLRSGDISASVWTRDRLVQGEMTRFYSVTFERSYKDATGKYCYTRSFDPDDLGTLVGLCQQVIEYINGLSGAAQETARA